VALSTKHHKPHKSPKPPTFEKKFHRQKRLPSIYGTVATFIWTTKISKTGVFLKSGTFAKSPQTTQIPKTPYFCEKISPIKTLTVNIWDGKHFYLAYKISNSQT
jgi:hypothetical protein